MDAEELKKELNQIVLLFHNVFKNSDITDDSDKMLYWQFKKIVDNFDSNLYFQNLSKVLLEMIRNIKLRNGDYISTIFIMNYLVLANKYHNKYLTAPLSYQIDIIEALYNTKTSSTSYDNILPALLDPAVIERYGKLSSKLASKYHYLEELIEEIIFYSKPEKQIKEACTFLNNHLGSVINPLDENFNIENLFNYYHESLQTLLDLKTENIPDINELTYFKKLENLNDEIIERFLTKAKIVYLQEPVLLRKIEITIMIARTFYEKHHQKVINLSDFKRDDKNGIKRLN